MIMLVKSAVNKKLEKEVSAKEFSAFHQGSLEFFYFYDVFGDWGGR